MAYFEICNLAKSEAWTQHTDDTGNVYMHNAENGHWVGYDTSQTVERKVKTKPKNVIFQLFLTFFVEMSEIGFG